MYEMHVVLILDNMILLYQSLHFDLLVVTTKSSDI